MNDKLLMEKEPRKAGVTTSDKGITIDDMKFHQCVKLPKFDKERSITFIPPDGSFELMSYRITQNINLPKIIPVYTEVAPNKWEIRVKLKAIYDKNLNANNVVVKIPSPKSTASVNSNTLVGRAKYEPENGAIMWRIKKFQGEFECFLQCEVLLSSSMKDKAWVKPPIGLEF
jgi:AP-2 complex subunit mu-1